jgi:putative transcriptional regulator
MSKEKVIPVKGTLLISAPFLSDIFKRSVVLLTEHNNEGSVGFIINKPLKMKFNEVIEDFPEFNAKIFLGGPVQPELVNFIHKAGNLLDGGVEIIDGIFWGGNFQTLKILAEQGSLNPEDFRFFLGYSGWSPNQLISELEIDSWFLNNSNKEYIFDPDSDHLWQKILKSKGGEYSVISTFPEDPSVN